MPLHITDHFKNRQILRVVDSPYNGFLDAVCAYKFLSYRRVHHHDSIILFKDVVKYYSNLIHPTDKNIKINGIERFCQQNGVKINMLRLEPNLEGQYEIVPYKTFNKEIVQAKKTINMICMKVLDKNCQQYLPDKEAPFLYGLVKSVNRLVYTDLVKKCDSFEDKQKNRSKDVCRKNPFAGKTVRTVCTNCLYFKFRSKKSMEKHKVECMKNRGSVKEYPQINERTTVEPRERKNVLRFRVPVHLCIYIDFETKMVKKDGNTCTECFQEICECDNDVSKTYNIHSHQPICWSMTIVSERDELIHQKTVGGNNCVDKLFDHLQQIEGDLIARIKKYEKADPYQGKKENRQKHYRTKKCCLCGEAGFTKRRKFYKNKKESNKFKKVAHHSHFTGEYIGVRFSVVG